MITIAICAILIASVLSKGPCDMKLECQDRVFESDDRALCSGYRGCLGAEFKTTDFNPICSGARACQDSTITDEPKKMLCNGFESCRGIKKGVRATEKVACNGLKSCQLVIGKLTAPVVTVDGAIAAVNKKIVAGGTPPVGDNLIACNGHKSCLESNLISQGRIDCDGDLACRLAAIKAETVIACGGKRACYESTIRLASTLYAYGFNAAALAQITGKGGDEEIKALGMNALLGATVTSGPAGTTTIKGYGWRSLINAEIKCLGTTTCKIECRMNACKGTNIFVASGASVELDPPECDPRDPNYVGPSKKDATLPARAKGINCPSLSGPGARLEDADLDIEEWSKKNQEALKLSQEYLEMVESTQIAEEALDAMIQEQVAAFDALDEEEQEQELMVVGHSVSHKSHHNTLTSNLLTALAVFIMTSVGSLCYIAYKFGGNGETKALLQ